LLKTGVAYVELPVTDRWEKLLPSGDGYVEKISLKVVSGWWLVTLNHF
jgi:hypothetical protein